MSVEFALNATEASPWFILLGRGELKAEIPGTWAGSVSVQCQRPDGDAATYMMDDGTPALFTSNPGVMTIRGGEMVRFSFSRDSGTAEPYAWSNDGLLHLPFSALDMAGNVMAWMNGDYMDWMKAP